MLTCVPGDENVNIQTYCVADGQGIPKEDQKEWFRSELRFISIILPADAAHPKGSKAPILSVSWAPWFYLIASYVVRARKRPLLIA